MPGQQKKLYANHRWKIMGKFFCLLVSIYVCMFYLFSKDLNHRWKLMGKCQRQFLTKTLALLLSISSRWSRRQRWRRIKRKRSNEQQHVSMWCVHGRYCIQCFTDIEFGNRLREENTEISYNLHLILFCFWPLFETDWYVCEMSQLCSASVDKPAHLQIEILRRQCCICKCNMI